MIAIDTNVLVYARRATAPQHATALRVVRRLATGADPWALPYPCVGEFLRVVTHRAFRPAVPMGEAWHNVEALLASPSVVLLLPTGRHLTALRDVLEESGATGDLVHDAQIAALCLEHGVREILTADRDFRRFRGLKVTDPFA
jgi:hypothetical protein